MTTHSPVGAHQAAPPASERGRGDVDCETRLLADARASAIAGHTVAEEEVDAWIDSLGAEGELPAPRSSR